MIKDIPRDTVKEQIKDIRLDTRKELILDTIKEQIRDTFEEGVFDRDRRSRRTSPFRDERRSTRASVPLRAAVRPRWSHRLRARRRPVAAADCRARSSSWMRSCSKLAEHLAQMEGMRQSLQAQYDEHQRCWRSSSKSMTSPAAEAAAGDPGDFARTGSTRGARDPAP